MILPIRDLYRREGIRLSTYYAWLKDFMEAGKDRLQRDTIRDATECGHRKIPMPDKKHGVKPSCGGNQARFVLLGRI